ncbi:hypothetical protein BVY00_00400 [bacterium G20]|nr:hypothetical protein BVY00_00400 [bacterium G20]
MNDSFWSQVFASLIGAFSAFLLSIILFFVTQSARNRKQESQLAANAASEIETDISMLDEVRAQIDDLCQEIEIETDKTKLYIPMRYVDILYVFLPQTYSGGLLREILSSIEITELNRVINRNSKQTDDVNLLILNNYKQGTEDVAGILRFFRSQKKQAQKDINFLRDIQQRLNKLSKSKSTFLLATARTK